MTIETARLIDSLSQPSAFSPMPSTVEILQTHISIVALVGDLAYKVRKAVNLGFLDFTSLEKRRFDCLEEVRLNRRLADDVYLDVVPIVRTANGVRVEGEGVPIEWAVKMRRLPEEASLLTKLRQGRLDEALLVSAANRIAAFHAAASRQGQAADGGFDTVATNMRENFEQVSADIGTTVSVSVLAALRTQTEAHLTRLRPLIKARTGRGMPCDGHGDLRLEHIYSFPKSAPPSDLVIIDCIEFNERFRFADPICDMAFLVMELLFRGAKDLARSFADAYFRSSGDEEGRKLLAIYVAYRSVVRAKVRGFEVREHQLNGTRRAESLSKARAHFLLALGVLEPPTLRPVLVLMGGLPGTAKSTVARGLAERAGFEVIRSDVVRKELPGRAANESAAGEWHAGIYSRDWTVRTYAACQRRAEVFLLEGKRVIVDASFADEEWRTHFLRAACSLCVPVVWFVCRATSETIRRRLARRSGDASDAGWSTYERARQNWTAASAESARILVDIDTEGGDQSPVDQALSTLAERALRRHADPSDD